MKVAEARRQKGIRDEAGREPSKPIPKGDALLAAGTANQTKLAGGPVSGPLFDFAPQANEYLRTHLFGDIFERDNLDWQSRELATVSMLAAMSGVEPQLQSHIGISMNIGVRPEQLSGWPMSSKPDSAWRLPNVSALVFSASSRIGRNDVPENSAPSGTRTLEG